MTATQTILQSRGADVVARHNARSERALDDQSNDFAHLVDGAADDAQKSAGAHAGAVRSGAVPAHDRPAAHSDLPAKVSRAAPAAVHSDASIAAVPNADVSSLEQSTAIQFVLQTAAPVQAKPAAASERPQPRTHVPLPQNSQTVPIGFAARNVGAPPPDVAAQEDDGNVDRHPDMPPPADFPADGHDVSVPTTRMLAPAPLTGDTGHPALVWQIAEPLRTFLAPVAGVAPAAPAAQTWTAAPAHMAAAVPTQILRIALAPVSLGAVDATLRLAGQHVDVRLVFSQPAAAREIAAHLDDLDTRLREAGLDVGTIQVSIRPDSAGTDGPSPQTAAHDGAGRHTTSGGEDDGRSRQREQEPHREESRAKRPLFSVRRDAVDSAVRFDPAAR